MTVCHIIELLSPTTLSGHGYQINIGGCSFIDMGQHYCGKPLEDFSFCQNEIIHFIQTSVNTTTCRNYYQSFACVRNMVESADRAN